MRASFHESRYSGVVTHPPMNDYQQQQHGRGIQDDPYQRPMQSYIPQTRQHIHPASTLPYDMRSQYDTTYHPISPVHELPRQPSLYGPTPPRPLQGDPRLIEASLPQRHIYPDGQGMSYHPRALYSNQERNVPSMTAMRRDDRPSMMNHHHERSTNYVHDISRDYQVHGSLSRHNYYGDTYHPPITSSAMYPDQLPGRYMSQNSIPLPLHQHHHQQYIKKPSLPPVHISSSSPSPLGYGSNGYNVEPVIMAPPGGVHVPSVRPSPTATIVSHPVVQHHETNNTVSYHGVGLVGEKEKPTEYLHGPSSPHYTNNAETTEAATTELKEPLPDIGTGPLDDDNNNSDDYSSIEEPNDERYYDDDTIATQDGTDNGIDFLTMDASKRPDLNLDFSQLDTVDEDELEPELTTNHVQSKTRMYNPLDPRRWYLLPPPNRISILKGTRYARNSPTENSVTFVPSDITKISEAEYMYGVPDEVIWWTKAELNLRMMEDEKERQMNPIAKMYDYECSKAYERLQDRIKRALDRNRHPKPNIPALWDDVKLAKLIKHPIMTGLSFGCRGIELGGMAGRRHRARGHLEMIQEYLDESRYRTKRRVRTARRGDAMGIASEEYTLLCRLWARAIALADQASATITRVPVVTSRSQIEI